MRFLAWTGVEGWLTEAAAVELGDDGLRATGTQLGAEPVPYRVDYRLEAPERFVTRELELTATAEGWRRRMLLRHDGSGIWQADVDDEGTVPGGAWDGELPDLSGALDIDVENSPLTNTMPILRNGFHRQGAGDLLMAFVAVPTLRVETSPQRYEHVSAGERRSVVRYVSRDSDFRAELDLDADGIVTLYPGLARRVNPHERAGPAQ